MKKILFIASHRKDRAPGQRFRFEQYFDYLESQGFQCELSHIISEKDDKMLYKPGNYFKKFLFIVRAWQKRAKDKARAGEFDIIFIAREALLTRSMHFERAFSRSKAKVVFDFDDSIWLTNVSAANQWFKFLKGPGKTPHLIGMADLVTAGNQYLADYARPYNEEIRIVPTTIDTEMYQRIELPKQEQVCIGWSGSITTIQHFELALPFLKKIKEKYGDKVTFKVIGDGSYRQEELGIQGLPWTSESEVRELSGIDIGIMPLPDSEWAKGKCGLKGLQYMALSIPTLMSPVGVNTEIIQDGENGYLAKATEEWVEKISALIESPELRQKMGAAARQTVLDKYSVEANKSLYLQCFQEVLDL